jgi:hypothetical protein
VGALLLLALLTAACGDITAEPSTRSCAADQSYENTGPGEPERAATFAIRAGGSAGFLDEGPTYRDYVGVEVTETGFVASFEPQLEVDLVLDERTWRVVAVDGVIDEETCLTLLGYSEEDSTEEQEHQFLNVRLRSENKRNAVRAALIGAPMWTGPIPYEGFRSRCYAQLYDEDGKATHRTRYYPLDIPKKETNRNSGNTFIEVDGDAEAASGEFVCETVPITSS